MLSQTMLSQGISGVRDRMPIDDVLNYGSKEPGNQRTKEPKN
jgi:hypothetical protein